MMRGMNEIGFDHHIFIQKFCGKLIIRPNAAHFRGADNDDVWLVRLHPLGHRGLVQEIELLAIRGQNHAVFIVQGAHSRAANHSLMAGDKNFFSRKIKH